MNINDKRFTQKEIAWDALLEGQVYVSSRKQKYMLTTQEGTVVCLESGEVFDADEMKGDVFIPVTCTLEIN